jgi:metal-responsive CopG/Arc/MetJ family transcriptional regulator
MLKRLHCRLSEYNKEALKEMQQLTIRIPEEYFSKIEQIAKSSGLKKSDVSRMAIQKFLKEYSNEEGEDLYSKAKRLIGVVESGISDLGQNHREYVIKKIKGTK